MKKMDRKSQSDRCLMPSNPIVAVSNSPVFVIVCMLCRVYVTLNSAYGTVQGGFLLKNSGP